MSLTDEQQAYLNVMQIAEFPVEFEHGLFFIDPKLLSKTTFTKQQKVATQDFDRIKTAFFEWTDNK